MLKSKTYLISFLIPFLSLICNAQDYFISLQEIQENKGVNAIVRKDNRKVILESYDKMKVENEVVVTILNKNGLHSFDKNFYYNDEYKITKLEAEIYDSSGNLIRKIKEKDFVDRAYADGFSLFNDLRVKTLEFSSNNYPFTLTYKYSSQTENTASIPTFYFVKDYSVSVLESKLIFENNTGEKLEEFNEVNLENFPIEKSKTYNTTIYTANFLQPLKAEGFSPVVNQLFPFIQMRLKKFHLSDYDADNINNWNDLGEWYHQTLLDENEKVSEETIKKIRNLTDTLPSDYEKAKAIYEYVQDQTRYVSVQIGIGGLQPTKASIVDNYKYGDCKGLSNYTKVLLKNIGIESYLAIVQAGREKVDIDENFSNLNQGNHMILAIPIDENLHWIDCTSKNNPFNFLGDFTDDRKVFLITPNGGEIVKTPSYIDNDNLQTTKVDYIIKPTGEIQIKAIVNSYGVTYDNERGLLNLSAKELNDYDKKRWYKIRDLEIQKHKLNHYKDSIMFEEDIELKGRLTLKKASDKIIIPLHTFTRNKYVPDRIRNRKNPFQIDRGYQEVVESTLKLPENYILHSTPTNISIKSNFGEYTVEYQLKNDELYYKKTILIKQGFYPETEYVNYREFREKIAYQEDVTLIIKQI